MTKEDLNQLVTIQDLNNLYFKIKADILELINQNKKEFYTPKEFSKITGIPHRTILNYCNSGKIKALQKVVGGAWVIHYTELENFTKEAEQNKYRQ